MGYQGYQPGCPTITGGSPGLQGAKWWHLLHTVCEGSVLFRQAIGSVEQNHQPLAVFLM